MIVPRINVAQSQEPDDTWQQELISQIRHWSLLGPVCVWFSGDAGERADGLTDAMRSVIRKTAGHVDLLVADTTLDDAVAIEYLNDGVSQLLVSANTSVEWPSVPDDRMEKVGPTSDDRIVIADATIEVPAIVELHQTKNDVLIDAKTLSQQPELICEFLTTVLRTDRPDGLWPTIICDPLGIALGLAYSNVESLTHAVTHREGAYWSRSRGELWVKGKTSGATQQLISIRMDCDQDCLRFVVTQDPPGFCHRQTHTCFGEERSIATVEQRLKQRIDSTEAKSFTRKLATDTALLEKKLLEEAKELSEASQTDDRHEIAWEAADVLYFSLVAMLKNGVPLADVHAELARRMNRVERRD